MKVDWREIGEAPEKIAEDLNVFLSSRRGALTYFAEYFKSYKVFR